MRLLEDPPTAPCQAMRMVDNPVDNSMRLWITRGNVGRRLSMRAGGQAPLRLAVWTILWMMLWMVWGCWWKDWRLSTGIVDGRGDALWTLWTEVGSYPQPSTIGPQISLRCPALTHAARLGGWSGDNRARPDTVSVAPCTARALNRVIPTIHRP